MKNQTKIIFTLKTLSLLCILGLSTAIQAAENAGRCPVSHLHMGHGGKPEEGAHTHGYNSGRNLAEKYCNDCHGKEGISKSDDVPNLVGQDPIYLCKSLDAYRVKVRNAVAPVFKDAAGHPKEQEEYVPSMNEVAEKLKDQDIVDLAEYFAHLRTH